MMKNKHPHIGSSLDDFLKEEDILEETRAATSFLHCHPERSEVVRISGRRTESKDLYSRKIMRARH